jgi:hypothetical protein
MLGRLHKRDGLTRIIAATPPTMPPIIPPFDEELFWRPKPAEFEFVTKLSVEELVADDAVMEEPLGVLLVKDAEEVRGTEELDMFADVEILAVAIDEIALERAVGMLLEMAVGLVVTL